MAPYIFQVGLPWNDSSLPSDMQKQLHAALDHATGLFTVEGYDFEHCFVTPEEGVGRIVELISKRMPDGVVVGFGIRGSKELTPLLEEAINTVKDHAPKAKIMFNTSPDSGLASAKKWVPL